MLVKLVMILDKRKELPAKYKKLIENSGTRVLTTPDLEKAIEFLTEFEPDLIIVSDSLDVPLAEICKKLRMLSYGARPCIIAVSKSEDLKDKLSVLDSGADDFLSEPIDSEEFKARINAHLRRHFEGYLNEITQLPNAKISLKVLKRTIKETSGVESKWAGMLVKINEFDSYRELYGELAADKMLQTYTAIINTTLDENDFMGDLGEGEFLVLTNALKAEHVASFLVYAFEAIVEKFYSEEDAKSGYIILYGDDNAGKRVPLVSTSLGVISSESRNYDSVSSALNALFAACKLAKLKTGSSYIVERTKISADDAILKKEFNRKIVVVEPDDALNFLLKTTAEMQGYEIAQTQDFNAAFALIKTFEPALVILDAGIAETLEGLELCKKLKKDCATKHIKTILSTVVHDKKLILNTGADLYLPKPYELLGVFNWIEQLVQDFNE